MNPCVVVVLLVLGVLSLWYRDRKRKFQGVPSIGYENYILSWWTVQRLLRNATETVQEGYDKYKGGAFKIPELNGWRLIITGLAQVDDLRKAPDDVLSFEAAINESVQSEYILGPAIVHNPYHTDVIRTQLTRNIRYVFPEMCDELVAAVDDAIPVSSSSEWVKVPALDTVMQIVCRITNRVFVGQPLCRNPDYRALNIQFTLDFFLGGMIMRLFPNFLKPLACRWVTSVPRNIERGMKHLEPVILERFAMMEKYGENWHDKPNDMLQWLIDSRDEKDVRVLVLRILTINFAAIHTTSMSFTHALYRLAANPEYVQPMREEVEHVVAEEGWNKNAMQKMRKVDSFLKECQRMYALGSISMDRKALQDFTFSDGTFVPKGGVVSVAVLPIHMDPAYYENPEVFDPWRFADMRDQDGEGTKHQLVSTTLDYMAFAHGRHACPGRFFAANELKCMMAYLVANYDLKLEREREMPKPGWFIYNSFPNRTAEVMFRKRGDPR